MEPQIVSHFFSLFYDNLFDMSCHDAFKRAQALCLPHSNAIHFLCADSLDDFVASAIRPPPVTEVKNFVPSLSCYSAHIDNAAAQAWHHVQEEEPLMFIPCPTERQTLFSLSLAQKHTMHRPGGPLLVLHSQSAFFDLNTTKDLQNQLLTALGMVSGGSEAIDQGQISAFLVQHHTSTVLFVSPQLRMSASVADHLRAWVRQYDTLFVIVVCGPETPASWMAPAVAFCSFLWPPDTANPKEDQDKL